MRTRDVPLRTCVACRTKTEKRRLVRIVRRADGAVVPDASGKAPGRGAYLCPRLACWKAGLSRARLSRALKLEEGLPAVAVRELMAYAEERFGAGEQADAV